MVSNIVGDSPFKIFIGGLPNYLTDEQVNIFDARLVSRDEQACFFLFVYLDFREILNRFTKFLREKLN